MNDEQPQKEYTAIRIHNAGKFLKVSKFKQELKTNDVDFYRLETTNAFISLVFDAPEKLAFAQEWLQKQKNYQDKPYKLSIIENYQVQQSTYKPNNTVPSSEESLSESSEPVQTTPKTLFEITQPLLNNPNELLLKQKSVRNALHHQLTRTLKGQTIQSQNNIKKTHQLPKIVPKYFANEQVRKNSFHLHEITSGKVTSGYRTKGEFMIQRDTDGVKIGSFYRIKDQFHVFSAEEMQENKLFPVQTLKLLQIVQNYFNQNQQEIKGLLVVKTSGDVENEEFKVKQMLIKLDLENTTVNQQEFQMYVKSEIKNMFETELVFDTDKNQFITQQLFGLSFRIYSESFFQQNIEVFQLICKQIKEYSSNPKCIYDICCGTGVIGQIMARLTDCKKIIGVDIVPEAIQSAQEQFQLNNFTDTEATYICGPVEKHLDIFNDCSSDDFVILDPPRSGLHPKVLKALRQSNAQQLVYVSCNPKSLAADLYGLTAIDCEYVKSQPVFQSIPFCIKETKLFNMFVGCEHVETVVVLQRCKDAEGTI
ncbi:23S_rRNA (Uracil-5-)-methyltransferase RumA [Hexamita inflata]|uniref:23S rRNA (Uracil-5-)-methyltransferase RumA n=1 Tax=Hexamita inflata TaxID=28002 RepID=A0AA86NHS6_9EUKA|nr:23S rRNA (Uracil-5-)-methyltransferase RumA [Hexamita inflata]